MFEHTLKTYKPGSVSAKPHFYILNRGLNSGKPLENPCPNCFILETSSDQTKHDLYWLCLALWKTKAFQYDLKGSVIPFISIGDTKKRLIQGITQAMSNRKNFEKTIQVLQLLDEKEKQFQRNLALIAEVKQAVILKFYKRR